MLKSADFEQSQAKKASPHFHQVLETDKVLDNVMKFLSAEDLAQLSRVNKTTQQTVAPVVPQVLAQEMFQDPPEPEEEKQMELLPKKGFVQPEVAQQMDTQTNPLKARQKIDYLAAKKQIATRALNKGDAKDLALGRPLVGEGNSKSVLQQVQKGKSQFISATDHPSNKFSGGSSGHVAIKRPEHYVQKHKMHKKYPQTVKAPDVSEMEFMEHNRKFLNHETVLEQMGKAPESDVRNVVNAREVMFQEPLHLKHVVDMSGGLPQAEIKMSKQALERQEAKKARGKQVDKGAAKQISKHFKGKEVDLETIYDEMPDKVIQAGRKAQVAWLSENYPS